MSCATRVLLFVNGNNWYLALKEAGISRLAHLSYMKIAKKHSKARECRAIH
ncbi:MAG: hypothetical protein JW841_15800 [Deltaproteobacteria bacterium]|nr:hypothetical protein [Deltaproteobacteria bacterium]